MISLFVVLASFITSCEKDNIYDPNNVKNTADLKVPAGFDWTTTRAVTLAVSSEVSTTASIYLDKACSPDQLVAQFIATREAREITVDVPKLNDQIFVQYTAKDGNSKVAPYSLGLTKASSIMIKLPEGVQEELPAGSSDKHLILTYSYGNIMFEDNWPVRGDYDFNDFVIRYKTTTATSIGGGAYDKEGFTVDINFLAIGGAYAYNLGLQLDELPAKYIDDFKILQTTGGLSVELVNQGEDTPAIFIFKGTENLKGKDGAKYFNTEQGHITANNNQLPKVSFKIYVNCYNNFPKNRALTLSSYSKNQNFFLKTGGVDGKEIHLRGYEPTHLYKDYEKDADGRMSDVKYADKNDFVWGIKTAYNSYYPYEGIDMVDAFPRFKNWVSTGSWEYENWYKTYTPGKVVELTY